MLRQVDSLSRIIASSPPLMSTSQVAWCWIGCRLGSAPDWVSTARWAPVVHSGSTLRTVPPSWAGRRVVQCQSARKTPPKHGGCPDREPTIDPEVALNSPAVARLETAPGPGLQHGGIASLRDERVPGRRVVAGTQFGHAMTAYRAPSGKGAPARHRQFGYRIWPVLALSGNLGAVGGFC